jgi:hypothetical protein
MSEPGIVKPVGENAEPFHEYDVPEPFAAVFQPVKE